MKGYRVSLSRTLLASVLVLFSPFLSSSLLAAPPTVDVPAEVSGAKGAFIVVTAVTDGKNAQFFPIDAGLNVFPANLLTDPKTTVVTAAEDGVYRLLVYSGNADGASLPKLVFVKVGTATAPPPKPKDPPTLPPTGSLYFVIVRPNGPALESFTQMMALPEWNHLRRSGHLFKDKTLDEAVALGVKLPAGTALPCVAILRERVGGKTSEQLLITPAPISGAGVLALPGLVKN